MILKLKDDKHFLINRIYNSVFFPNLIIFYLVIFLIESLFEKSAVF